MHFNTLLKCLCKLRTSVCLTSIGFYSFVRSQPQECHQERRAVELESMSRQYYALAASSLPLAGVGFSTLEIPHACISPGDSPPGVLRQAGWILEEWQEALCHVQTVPRLTKWPPWPPSCPDPPPLSHSQSPCLVKPMSALLSTSLKLSTSQPSTTTHSVPNLLWRLLPPVLFQWRLSLSSHSCCSRQEPDGPLGTSARAWACPAQNSPYLGCPSPPGSKVPMVFQHLPFDFPTPRVSTPHLPLYCAQHTGTPPTGPMCPRAPPGGFSPIHPWGWFNWRPSSVTLFCICTHTVPPCPSSIFSHFKCPHITPRFHLLSSTPLPTTPSINSTKASNLI